MTKPFMSSSSTAKNAAHERAFFESMASSLSPGWHVRLGKHLSPGSGDFANLNTYIYVVDTSRFAVISGAMAADGFAKSRDRAIQEGLSAEAVKSSAGYQAQSLFDQAVLPEDAPSKLSLVAAALTYTRAFEVAQSGPGVDGHWLYMIYRAVDQSVISRPVFFRQAAAGLVPPGAILAMTKQVIAQDLSTGPTSVAEQLALGGGAVLDEALRPRGYPAHTYDNDTGSRPEHPRPA